ncbi:MAG: META domain-containing protein [Chloroflexia bacterium]
MHRKLRFFLAIPLLAFVLFAAVGSANAQHAGLSGTAWKLTSIKSSTGVKNTADQNITLNFDSNGHAVGQSTCNSYGGDYAAGNDGSLTLSQIISTLRACVDNALMDLEREYYDALNTVSSYITSGDTLEITYANNGVLIFQSVTATVGMPQTGFGIADATPFAILGVSLILLGSGFLYWKHATSL